MSAKPEQKVWLVTGCSQGLGSELCKSILAAGHKVVASSRYLNKTPEKISQIRELGGAWVKVDVAGDELEQQVDNAVEVYGRIDVLVNNAGMGMAGAVEDSSMDKIRFMFETNFFGPLRLIKSLTPHMRARGSGTMINISSASTWRAMPGITLYATSKYAIDGFGIRVLLVVPGDMRTNFVSPANQAVGIVPLSEPYKGTMVDHVTKAILAMDQNQPTDPAKVALRLVEMVDGTGVPGQLLSPGKTYSRIPIGTDSGEFMRKRGQEFTNTANVLEPIWSSVDI